MTRLMILGLTIAISTWSGLAMAQGFSVGNFGISAEVSRVGALFKQIRVNPARLGPWLEDLGSSELTVRANGVEHKDRELAWERIADDFPEFRARSVDPALQGIEIEVSAFAPMGVGEGSDENFLPCVILELTLTNRSPRAIEAETHYRLRPTPPLAREQSSAADATILSSGRAFIASADAVAGEGIELRSPRTIPPGASARLRILVGAFEETGRYATRLRTREGLVRYVLDHVDTLRARHADFAASLPRINHPEIDRAIRWYLSAAVLLTRGTRQGEILTMGYSELNQRDSFWTSWIHLFFWPDLERKMIRESIAAQGAHGKIPTTILPLIERAHDIDITEYFVLRVLRYYEWHRDRAFLEEAWPAVQRALAYLRSLDTDGIGLPKQVSYWADWKDVPGIEDRTYAPHFSLLWLAVLERSARAARALGRVEEAEALERDHARAFAAVHRAPAEGGLWNGRHYVDLWSGGRVGTSVLQDQVVGVFFGATSAERAGSVFDSLLPSETRWGVRETFPYLSRSFEQPHGGGGNYHNGGIWPWLCFVDATGRYLSGRTEDAERIVSKVAFADLFEAGDRTPHEFMNGDSGIARGLPIQGWNGAIFATTYLGALGVERVSDETLRIRPRVGARDLDTRLVLPGGRARLLRKNGVVSLELEKPLPYAVEVGQTPFSLE